ncbi:hypothetical protein GINT2_000865 [Glugoides intestinalis]
MDQSTDKDTNCSKQQYSLFEEETTKPSCIFDDQFESKLSVWMSYNAKKSVDVLKEEHLDNAVLDTISDSRKLQIKPFWNTKTEEILHNGPLSVQEEESSKLRLDFADETSVDDLLAIEPKVLQKIIFEKEPLSKRHSCESLVHPFIESHKRQQIGVEEVAAFPKKSNSLSLNKDQPSIQGKTSTFYIDDNGHSNVKNNPSAGSIDIAGEVIQNLENKIRMLELQLVNSKKAIEAKDLAIKDINTQAEMQINSLQEVDYDYIHTYAKQGLEIVERLRNYTAPQDMSEEVHRLKLENLHLKSIIEELAAKLRGKALQTNDLS